MKKLVCIAAMALFGFGSLSAQERSKGEIEITPFIGYQQSFFNGDNIDLYEPKSSFTFGVNGDYFFNDRWSLRSGLGYDTMGSAIKGSNNDVELDYLSIPINANWHFGSTRKWNLNFGISTSFLLSANQVGNTDDIKDEVNSFQLGISYGIGYKLAVLDNFSILFDWQGLVGVTNFINNPGSDLTQLNARGYFSIGGVFVL
tara:strand:+ start:2047 stop:2649 length:603 start_codon:yes stop_codon:yes gene_type:complete